MPVKQPQINMADLLDAVNQNYEEVYSDAYFSRNNIKIEVEKGIEVYFLVDFISELKMGVAYIKIHFSKADSVELYLDSSYYEGNSKGTFVRMNDRDAVFWLPGRIFAREYLDNGNICRQSQIETTQSDEIEFRLTISGQQNQVIELQVVFATERGDEFITQIDSTLPLEEQIVKLGMFFKYSNIDDVWEYLIAGNIYRHMQFVYDIDGDLRWPCQQTANLLYSHLVYLYSLTGKYLYRFLYDLVAYSVMLSLDDEGRWRHGLWCPEIMETHTRFQVSGVFLLTSYYEKTNRGIFLQKARGAMDYIIGLADQMGSDGLWFVHDSLEQKGFKEKCRYKNDFNSQAFGKSQHNSLCLNTHIWTLLGFCMLKEVSGDDIYDRYIAKGTVSLKWVMEARYAEVIYRPVYWLRDLLISRFRRRIVRKNKWRYDKLLDQWILPYLKMKYPRLNMPNGFIERDLTHSRLSDRYHIVTLGDLLMLYAYQPSEWLEKILRKSMNYTHNSGFIRYFAQCSSNPLANNFLEMLLLYSSMIDESYLLLLPEYLSYLKGLGFVVSSDAVSNTMIISDEIMVCLDNIHLKALTVGHGNLIAVVLNPDREAQETQIQLHFLKKNKAKLRVIDSNDQEIALDGPVEIPALGFVKFIRRY